MPEKSELRRDLVCGDWILVSPARGRRPHEFATEKKHKPSPKKTCPFENPQDSGNGDPVVWYSEGGREAGAIQEGWKLQVINNKYPAVVHHEGSCPAHVKEGIYEKAAGIGFHEVVIPRSHDAFWANLSSEEAELIIRAYQDQIRMHAEEPCLEYVLVFHNHGAEAGASVGHPHSQIIALPIIPPDVVRSLEGAERYWMRHRECVHCIMVAWEDKQQERVIFKNKSFIVIAPFASHVSFEMRIFPLKHESRFENISDEDRILLAEAMTTALSLLKKGLGDPAFNFFIHTAPALKGRFSYYHWHMEILPKTAIFAGVELGTGIEIVSMPPEEAAEFFRSLA